MEKLNSSKVGQSLKTFVFGGTSEEAFRRFQGQSGSFKKVLLLKEQWVTWQGNLKANLWIWTFVYRQPNSKPWPVVSALQCAGILGTINPVCFSAERVQRTPKYRLWVCSLETFYWSLLMISIPRYPPSIIHSSTSICIFFSFNCIWLGVRLSSICRWL